MLLEEGEIVIDFGGSAHGKHDMTVVEGRNREDSGKLNSLVLLERHPFRNLDNI